MTGNRRSPLDALHRELGAKLVPFGGWEMPLSYPAGTIAEHLACRNEAALFDVSHLGTVRLEG
ncbi:MAG: glycine cleavage system protein T, partial [Actinomycetota bacterium]